MAHTNIAHISVSSILHSMQSLLNRPKRSISVSVGHFCIVSHQSPNISSWRAWPQCMKRCSILLLTFWLCYYLPRSQILKSSQRIRAFHATHNVLLLVEHVASTVSSIYSSISPCRRDFAMHRGISYLDSQLISQFYMFFPLSIMKMEELFDI